MSNLLEINNLRKEYYSKKKKVVAVNDISLTGDYGEVVGILGPNGSGKTSTIKSISTIIDFEKGDISLFGLNIKKNRKKVLQNIGSVLEGARNIHWRLTPIENLIYFAGLKGFSKRDVEQQMHRLLDLLDLKEVANKPVRTFSRGMQQKVAIACALIHNPKIVMLDEPTLGLDVETSRNMIKFIKEISQENRLIIITSHDMKFIESVCTKIYIMRKGSLIKEGSVKELKKIFNKKYYSLQTKERIDQSIIHEIKMHGKARHGNSDNELVFSIENHNKIYEIFDILRKNNVIINNLEIIQNDFEDVFLEIVKEES